MATASTACNCVIIARGSIAYFYKIHFKEQIQPCSYNTTFRIPIKLLISVNVAYFVGKL